MLDIHISSRRILLAALIIIFTIICNQVFFSNIAFGYPSGDSSDSKISGVSEVTSIMCQIWIILEDFGTPIFVIIIGGVGILFLLGKTNWVLVLTVVSGLVLAKAAPQIIGFLFHSDFGFNDKCDFTKTRREYNKNK